LDYEIEKLTAEHYKKITDLWLKCGLSFRPHGRDSREAIAKEMKRAETAFLFRNPISLLFR
jgi:hypothetical protein